MIRTALFFAIALATADVPAQEPRHDAIRLLIIDGQNNHDWPRATTILKEILEGSGLFAVDVSTSPSASATRETWDKWRPEFAKYRVVLSNYNGCRWPREVEKALENYVGNGGGLVIYHAANNSFPNWPAYNQMIGLGWRDKNFGPSLVVSPEEKIIEIPKGEGRNPGHGSEHDFPITVLNANHPITQGMPKKWMHPHEQLTHGQHGPAKNLTVLTYAWSRDTKESEPMDWVVPYGKGRVYTTLLGHLWKDGPDTAMRCVGFQTLLVRGCEWAATGKVAYPVPKDFPTANKIALAEQSPLNPGDHIRKLQVDGRTRSYLVHVPPKLDPKQPMPVVLAFHGAMTNGPIMAFSSGLSAKADEAGFIVVYPNGTGKGDMFLVWNAGGWHGPKAEELPDDVKFVTALLDDLAKVVIVDPRRIYATGMSNGGMMCYRLAAELSQRIAAIAPVSGTMAVEKCRPRRPVPVMHFHGTDDKLVPFEGPAQRTAKVLAFKSVEETIRTWAKIDGCPRKPKITKLPHKADDGTSVERKTYGPGKEGAEVILYVIHGGGHTWPGRKWPVPWLGTTTKDISASDLMWEFFKRHPMPTPQPAVAAFENTTKKTEDQVEVETKEGAAIFTFRCPTGIGGATMKIKDGKWPQKVMLRLRLKGLESLTIANGTIKLTGSVLSHGGNPRLLTVVEDGKEKKVGMDSLYWTEIRGFDSTGKAVTGLPGNGGYFEITLPKALLESHPKSLSLEWIDFYR
jgi:polyhydroxybutyrate depolymerase